MINNVQLSALDEHMEEAVSILNYTKEECNKNS